MKYETTERLQSLFDYKLENTTLSQLILSWVVLLLGLIVGWVVFVGLSNLMRGDSFLGTSDYADRNTGAGTGLWFNIVRPFDTKPLSGYHCNPKEEEEQE